MSEESKSTNEVSAVIIDDIVKKPRKARMSKIVEKAVLLKQISNSKILDTSSEYKPDPIIPPEDIPSVIIPSVATLIKVKTSERSIKKQKSKSTSLADIPLVATLIPPADNSVISINTFANKCNLCDIIFTSKILFDRHPKTIKHKTNLIKEQESILSTVGIKANV